jgi:hypothetical protein
MRLMFVYWAYEDQGSGLVIQGYTEAAHALGHEVAVYGIPYPKIPLNYSLDVGSADAIIFIFEWTTRQYYGDYLDLVRQLSQVPRRRRVILDGDGNYNDVLNVGGDYNHADAAASREWIDVCDSLTDKICQPTYHPLRGNVRPFLFYAYNPSWERPLSSGSKEFDMLYVGHSKFRWGPLHPVLHAIEPVRARLGRLALVGHGWDAPPKWADKLKLQEAYYSDPAYLRRLGVEILPAVPFGQVIDSMSQAVFNPILSRRLFNHLRLVTPRLFETSAASTIPLFALEREHVLEIYGEAALELVLGEHEPQEQILDIVSRPDHYQDLVREIRGHLREQHSHAARLRELIEIVES